MNQNGEVSPQIRKIITIVLLGSCFISLASQTMMVTALPVIQEDLHVSLNAVQWLTTGYTLIIGIVTPLLSLIHISKYTLAKIESLPRRLPIIVGNINKAIPIMYVIIAPELSPIGTIIGLALLGIDVLIVLTG